MKPDICTSMVCETAAFDYCPKCSHALYLGHVEIDGAAWYWEFSPHFGPRFGSEKHFTHETELFPGEKHPVWEHFQSWLDKFTKRVKADA